jgi:predicted metal-dependent peptidase
LVEAEDGTVLAVAAGDVSEKPALSEKELLHRISKARVRLVARVPFFGYLAMQLRPRIAKPEDNIPTAGIAPDGSVIFNPVFVAGLNDKELCGVIAHEVMHPALFFWARKSSRNHMLFNIAHDLSFNFLIEEMAGGEIILPDGVLLDPKFHGMAAEEIYQYLLKGDNNSGKTTIKTKGGGQITVDTNGNGAEGYGDCRQDLSETKDGKKAAQGDSSAGKKLENQWKLNLASAAQQHEARKSQGKLPAGLKRLIDAMLHPKLDWTEYLSRWCGENGRREEYSFKRPSRRSQSVGTTLPSMCAGGFADVVYLIDSSGSMSERELKRALGEATGILEEMGSEIRVLVCDAEVHVDMTVIEAMDIAIKGGGGSNFIPAFDLLDEEGYDGAVIAFTDGMISVPDEMPIGMKGVLWVTPDEYKPPTTAYGEHVAVSTEGDDEL